MSDQRDLLLAIQSNDPLPLLTEIQKIHRKAFLGHQDGAPLYACLKCIGSTPWPCPTSLLADQVRQAIINKKEESK